MRSRPSKRSIEPIHIRELLNGAGMRGFLSVLDPPVPAPHLRELGRDQGAREPCAEPWSGLSARVEALLGRFARQEQALRSVAEMAHRINCGAVVLQRGADSVCMRRRARRRPPDSREVR